MQTIILGGGCFWCTEAVFKRIPGVISVMPGYAGGDVDNPTYEEVCNGDTGHAEVIEVKFDERKIKLNYLLDVFFKTHDPTTLNQQGNDVGTQYRSIILFTEDSQKKEVIDSIKRAQLNFEEKLVTEIKKLKKFYLAEKYHQDYFSNNKNQPYCKLVILPKVNKIEKILKEGTK